MILTTEVEIKPNGKNMEYYKSLGYDARHMEPLIVKVADLQKGSHAKVDVLCDYCGQEIVSLPYYRYYQRVLNHDKITCEQCVGLKLKEVCKLKYGVDNISQLTDIQEKKEKTWIEHYGASNPLQCKDIKQKQTQTILNTYGVNNISQLETVKKQKIQTSLLHFGVTNPTKCKEVQEKIRKTNLQKYGVPYTQQSPEVRAKVNETLCKNGTQKTSKQQLYLHSLLGGEINYPISYYAVDICFPEEKVYLEYSGGGHDLRVILGRLTQEEFNQKEIIRNNVLKKEGYRKIEIVSKKDCLPCDDILFQMLTEAKCYFATTPHTWVTYDIDQSLMFNAEHKDGISYSYGKLRTIKNNDIQTAQAV